MEASARRRIPNPGLPYREDCWSEGETAALVDAWGDRYIELNRGHLRAKHWQEVADAVNSRGAAEGRPRRTDIQCKNRIDTLKKKYKMEKARIEGGGSAAVGGSKWRFYNHLDVLISSSIPSAAVSGKLVGSKRKSSSSPSPPMALPLPFYRKGMHLPTAVPIEQKTSPSVPAAFPLNGSFIQKAAAAAAAAANETESSDSDSVTRSPSPVPPPPNEKPTKSRKIGARKKGEDLRNLAMAVQTFAEIYERVEVGKLRQEMELEKQRMEFAKAVEFHRMQIFVDSQVQIEKMKKARLGGGGVSAAQDKSSDAAQFIGSIAALPYLLSPPLI